jgi:hypothetical protein
VELHGGKVAMDSAVGIGTTVTVEFPACRNQKPGSEARGQKSEVGRSRSALWFLIPDL